MLSDPGTLGAGAKTRLEPRMKKFTPHCVCRPRIHAAKVEALEMVLAFLVRHHPRLFEVEGGRCHNRLTGEDWQVAPPYDEDPLLVASMLANEDLVVMATDPVTRAHVCAAAVVMFPSGWDLPAKFGQCVTS